MGAATSENPMISCLKNVRRMDHDRFLTILAAPFEVRFKLVALYAFNAELARVRETVSEPMLGQIRLQWWRETVAALEQSDVRGHEVAAALSESFNEQTIYPGLLSLIDARERDLEDEPFADISALETYCEETSSQLIALAAEAISGQKTTRAGQVIRSAGIAYALTGLLRALPSHASQGRLYLPLNLLAQYDVDPHKIFAGEMNGGLRKIISDLVNLAQSHLADARSKSYLVEKNMLPAFWPASLCDVYLDKMIAQDFNPFRDPVEHPAFLRQLRLSRKKLFGSF